MFKETLYKFDEFLIDQIFQPMADKVQIASGLKYDAFSLATLMERTTIVCFLMYLFYFPWNIVTIVLVFYVLLFLASDIFVGKSDKDFQRSRIYESGGRNPNRLYRQNKRIEGIASILIVSCTLVAIFVASEHKNILAIGGSEAIQMGIPYTLSILGILSVLVIRDYFMACDILPPPQYKTAHATNEG